MARARLNHVAIAVTDPGRLKRLFSILGLDCDSVEDVPSEGVRAHFVPAGGTGVRFELLEPLDPADAGSPVAKFLSRRGGGLHHIAVELDRGLLDPTCERLRSEGFRLLYDKPRLGAESMRVNFIHPASAGGVLVEVVEHGD
jgi:methylmalonyl-CoA epimerase